MGNRVDLSKLNKCASFLHACLLWQKCPLSKLDMCGLTCAYHCWFTGSDAIMLTKNACAGPHCRSTAGITTSRRRTALPETSSLSRS